MGRLYDAFCEGIEARKQGKAITAVPYEGLDAAKVIEAWTWGWETEERFLQKNPHLSQARAITPEESK